MNKSCIKSKHLSRKQAVSSLSCLSTQVYGGKSGSYRMADKFTCNYTYHYRDRLHEPPPHLHYGTMVLPTEVDDDGITPSVVSQRKPMLLQKDLKKVVKMPKPHPANKPRRKCHTWWTWLFCSSIKRPKLALQLTSITNTQIPETSDTERWYVFKAT